MALLTKQQLVDQTPQRSFREVELPSNCPQASSEPVTVRLRSMFWEEHRRLLESLTDQRTGKQNEWRTDHFGELVAAFCWVDEGGKRILEDDDLNTDWWRKQDARFVRRLLQAAQELTGIGEMSTEQAVKNSAEIDGSDNSTEQQPGEVSPPPEISSTL